MNQKVCDITGYSAEEMRRLRPKTLPTRMIPTELALRLVREITRLDGEGYIRKIESLCG